mmetsp:Transcript_13254/g.49156  ORF Transcript_13254/g.49156 Transcript_13254/m.49156 type:complete len:256 (-) Transcript_13254:658-1425(-)
MGFMSLILLVQCLEGGVIRSKLIYIAVVQECICSHVKVLETLQCDDTILSRESHVKQFTEIFIPVRDAVDWSKCMQLVGLGVVFHGGRSVASQFRHTRASLKIQAHRSTFLDVRHALWRWCSCNPSHSIVASVRHLSLEQKVDGFFRCEVFLLQCRLCRLKIEAHFQKPLQSDRSCIVLSAFYILALRSSLPWRRLERRGVLRGLPWQETRFLYVHTLGRVHLGDGLRQLFGVLSAKNRGALVRHNCRSALKAQT